MAEIFFENFESFNIKLDKLSFKLKNGIIENISFNLNDLIKMYDYPIIERICKSSDICGVQIGNAVLYVNWQGDSTDENPCQKVSITGDEVFISFQTLDIKLGLNIVKEYCISNPEDKECLDALHKIEFGDLGDISVCPNYFGIDSWRKGGNLHENFKSDEHILCVTKVEQSKQKEQCAKCWKKILNSNFIMR